jgi:dTDP-4-amino-4,6-dideoxygalactose transaminase
MLVKTEAIVLHSFKFGESRLIVEMFTREVGRLSFAIPIPKTSKGKLKKQYFQPMTLLEIECDVRQRTQLQKLKDARILTAYTSLPFSPEKLAITLFTENSSIMPSDQSSRIICSLPISSTLCNGWMLPLRAMPISISPFLCT